MASTNEYFDIDRTHEDAIAPMLDEMHQGRDEDNDVDRRSTGVNDSSEVDWLGGVDEKYFRSGGVNC